MSLVLEADIYWRDMTYKLSHILILFLKHLAKCNFLNQLMEFWHDAILVFLNVFWLLMTSYFYFLASWSYIFVMALLFQKATKRVTFVRSLIREVVGFAPMRNASLSFSKLGRTSVHSSWLRGSLVLTREQRRRERRWWMLLGRWGDLLFPILYCAYYFILFHHDAVYYASANFFVLCHESAMNLLALSR